MKASENNLLKNKIMANLKNIMLINPLHIELVSDGFGEFPNGYKLTEEGANFIKNTLLENIKGELELADSPREYSDEMILASIKTLINEL